VYSYQPVSADRPGTVVCSPIQQYVTKVVVTDLLETDLADAPLDVLPPDPDVDVYHGDAETLSDRHPLDHRLLVDDQIVPTLVVVPQQEPRLEQQQVAVVGSPERPVQPGLARQDRVVVCGL